MISWSNLSGIERDAHARRKQQQQRQLAEKKMTHWKRMPEHVRTKEKVYTRNLTPDMGLFVGEAARLHEPGDPCAKTSPTSAGGGSLGSTPR